MHPLAKRDALAAARHRAFIAPRLVGSWAGFAILPIYLAVRGMPSALEMGVFAWLIVPLVLAYFLSHTGRYDDAHVFSALALTVLFAGVAWHTGGIASFAAMWLVLVPLEASLAGSRRVVILASIFALCAAGVLLLLANNPPVYAIAGGSLAALGLVAAALYGTGLALGAESIARRGLRLFHAEEDRYRLLAHNMTDVISRHAANGSVLFISPVAETLCNAPLATLLGHGLFDRVHVADRPVYLSTLAAAARGNAGSVEFRLRVEEFSARFVWVEMRCRPLSGADTSAEHREVVGVLRDVSDRKAQEQALADARAESDRAHAGKSHFLATMSHELRTPLNAIIGFSEMLANTSLTVSADRRLEYAHLINESGRHLLSLVNGILDMSKMESGNFSITPEPFAPGLVIKQCCGLLALKAESAGITLKITLPEHLPDIVADRRALNQVLINLLSNAIKFTDRGCSVTVTAERVGDSLAIAVSDTGVGIGEDDLHRVGEAFFQARSSYDRRHDGTGLGLSIVKGLVRLHGGKLEIRSRLAEGTSVKVLLPLDCEQTRHAPQPLVRAAKTLGQQFAASEKVTIAKAS